MVDTFYIGAYWGCRKELLESVINPTLQTLKGLSELDEQFLSFYELGISRKQALQYKIIPAYEDIKRLYLKRLKKTDLDKDGYSKIGYGLSLWTGQEDDESSQISFGVGSGSERIRNRCTIKIPSEGFARERLIKLDSFKRILSLLIQTWNPDIVILTSKELSTALDTTNKIGWVTYIKQLKNISKISSRLAHETNYYGGDLFYLKTNSGLIYDYSLIDEYQLFKKQIS